MSKKLCLIALLGTASLLTQAQTQRIAHESSGARSELFNGLGDGNFGQVPMQKIIKDSILIDSIMKKSKALESPRKVSEGTDQKKPVKQAPKKKEPQKVPAPIIQTTSDDKKKQ